MDRLTRKELKTDRFAVEVTNTLEYLSAHRRPAAALAAIVVIAILAGGGYYFYHQRRHATEQKLLRALLEAHAANVGTGGSPFKKSFTSAEEKDQAVSQATDELLNKYRNSEEGGVALYFRGVAAMERGDAAEAQRLLTEAREAGGGDFGSLASLSLAEVYAAQGKHADAEKLLRALVNKPTDLVSKEQATLALARVLAQSKPEEARKLMEPLRSERSAISRAAINLLGEIPTN